MVGPLKYFKRDPNGKGRGAGWYYHRGNGYYSKYSLARDRKHKTARKVRMWGATARLYKKKHRPGLVGSGPYKHTTDGVTKRKR